MRDVCDPTQDGEFPTIHPTAWKDGAYYWARYADGTLFVVKKEGFSWYTIGLHSPMVSFSPDRQIICEIKPPGNSRN